MKNLMRKTWVYFIFAVALPFIMILAFLIYIVAFRASDVKEFISQF